MSLSRRELEVLKLFAFSGADIADKLHISEGTAKTHIRRIFNKLGVKSRVPAVVEAIKEGIIKLDDLII